MTDVVRPTAPAQDDLATRPAPKRNNAGRWLHALTPLLTILALLVVWEFAVAAANVSRIVLPRPTEIFQDIFAKRYLLFIFAQTTILEIVVGFLVAAGIGIPLGVLIYSSPLAKRAFYPILVASQMVPKVAVAPLLVIWFGTGLTPKVMIAFIIAFFPIMVSTIVGLETVDTDMARMFRSMGAGKVKTFFKLRLPAALPNIFAGLKIGMSLSVVGAIVGEFVAADRGLGYYLLFANGQLDTVGVFAALIVLTAIGVVLYFLVESVQNLFIPAPLRKRGAHPEGGS